ncbi:MAG: BamA/TamA family outer membrane protein [Bacteroidia bacterium]|jgi:outer membrane protein assembly factor BamA|nr:BamA/TamA family outer membrane protein [Bacteroidia bacterium]
MRLFLSVIALLTVFAAAAQDTARVVVSTIVVRGNTQTKVPIILRELTFTEGDTIAATQVAAEMERSRQNLINTSLFNTVSVGQVCMPGDTMCRVVMVEVTERWYTWPTPLFEVAEPNINTWWRNGHNLARASIGGYLIRNNFRGRRETLQLKVRVGYAPQLGLTYVVPYLNRKQTLGFSVSAAYSQVKEVAFATRQNKWLFYRSNNTPLRTETTASAALAWRKGLYLRQTFELRFTDLRIADTVRTLAPDYIAGNNLRMPYFSFSWRLVFDNRDYRPYPLRGTYIELEAGRIGFAARGKESPEVNLLVAGLRRYIPLGKRWFAAGMLRARWMPGPVQPYYMRRAMGTSVYVRGYEYYVIDGQSYALAKATLRFQLLPTYMLRFKWFPMEKFNTIPIAIYTGIFTEAAYVQDRSSQPGDDNFLGNTWQRSIGAGADLVTYYDLVFRAEFAFNHLGERGIFLHAIAAF